MPNVVGYYQSWSCYNTCKVHELDPDLYTHMIYAFAQLKDCKLKANDHYGDIEAGGYTNFNNLKKRNSDMQTLLAVGGWDAGSKQFSNMVSSSSNRKTFIKSCLSTIEEYKFDGIDLDWEYPCKFDGSSKKDKKNFARLLSEMGEKFDDEGYLLSVAVSASEDTIQTSYDTEVMSDCVDFINLMTYDINVPDESSKVVGHNAPYTSDDGRNVKNSVQAWLDEDVNANKIMLGIAGYGRSYTLADPARPYIGAPAKGPGKQPTVSYEDVVKYQNNGWNTGWDADQCVPYMYRGNQWIGYDDWDSIRKKVQLADRKGLGGMMIWAIDFDDAHGTLKFPLSRACNNIHG